MSPRPTGPSLSVALSVAMHALLAGLLALGLWQFHSVKPPAQQLAIEATVVEGSPLQPAASASGTPPVVNESANAEPMEQATPPEPPEPADDSVARDQQAREQAARALAERQQQLQEQQARQAKASREAKAAKEAKSLQEAKEAKAAKEAQSAKEAKAAAEAKLAKQAQELRERQAKEARDKQQREQQAHEQQVREQQAREQQAREQQVRAANEAELRARMAAEERQLAAQNSGLLAQYQAQIRSRIERAWIRPPNARTGLSCEVRITQVPGGEVVGVRVGNCNGDESVRQSIEAAAYRASPLPLPADPSLFDRNLLVTFKPQD